MIADVLRFFAGAARCMDGRAAGEYMAVTRPSSAASRWRHRPDRALELPADDGGMEVRPGARGRQHGRAQARRADAAHDAEARRARPESSGGRPEHRVRTRRERRAPLVAHPGVDMVSLTGSVDTGKQIAGAAAATLKRIHLELGGKAPVIVFDDADLEAALERSPAPASTTPARIAPPRRASSRAPGSTTTSSPASPRRPPGWCSATRSRPTRHSGRSSPPASEPGWRDLWNAARRRRM